MDYKLYIKWLQIYAYYISSEIDIWNFLIIDCRSPALMGKKDYSHTPILHPIPIHSMMAVPPHTVHLMILTIMASQCIHTTYLHIHMEEAPHIPMTLPIQFHHTNHMTNFRPCTNIQVHMTAHIPTAVCINIPIMDQLENIRQTIMTVYRNYCTTIIIIYK